ncbi:MAG TPA: molybdate ABC transporter substrate-binding protein [Candidatus Limnocylindrales bacterium]|nr:molybdate ABC transporter substrate-binding protein [Candidatus Limnocylindrales bacterium]
MTRRGPRLAILLALAGCLAACAAVGPSSSADGPTNRPATAPSPAASGSIRLTVYGASSLKAALAAVASAYATVAPIVTLTVSTGASSALETQIEQGAPADVFLSADVTNPRKLVTDGFASGTPTPFAGNQLTIIVPSTNPGNVTSARDLARPGLKVIAAGATVPITTYANQLVANLAAEAGYPSSFSTAYAANIESRQDSVAAVVTQIELGQGDAAIVYVTDAKASTGVATIDVPADANVPATYAGVVVRASTQPVAAAAFLTWLAGPGGQAVLATFGFLPVNG